MKAKLYCNLPIKDQNLFDQSHRQSAVQLNYIFPTQKVLQMVYLIPLFARPFLLQMQGPVPKPLRLFFQPILHSSIILPIQLPAFPVQVQPIHAPLEPFQLSSYMRKAPV